MGIIDRLLGVAPAGEQSALRKEEMDWTTLIGEYRLNTKKVDYELARRLYVNEEDGYKLGAWPAKPVVNTTAGFMGAPNFTHKSKDDAVQGVLDEGINEWDTSFLKTNQQASLVGDVFARIEIRPNRFDQQDVEFMLRLIPPEWVEPIYDPLTGEFKEVVIKYPVHQRKREEQRNTVRTEADYYIVETITTSDRTLDVEGNVPSKAKEEIRKRAEEEADDNAWGFIPIVHIKNEGEEQRVYGMSDLEPIEPFMKAYHDVFLMALQGAKSVARPKVSFALKDVKKFLNDNFTEDEIKSGKLKYMNKELFLMQRDEAGGEDAVEFITADTGLAGVRTLLEVLFYCVVDISQTPEFAFGTAVASSKASVQEQMPVLARNIRRKRGDRQDSIAEIGSMYLAMQAQVGMQKPDTYRVDVEWEEISQKDDSEVATTIQTLIDGLVAAIDGGLMSQQAAVDFLQEFVPTMLPYSTEGSDADEKQRIVADALERRALENGDFDEDAPDQPPRLRPVNAGAGQGG